MVKPCRFCGTVDYEQFGKGYVCTPCYKKQRAEQARNRYKNPTVKIKRAECYKSRASKAKMTMDKSYWAKKRYNDIKHRALPLGIPFDISADDLLAVAQDVCPVFGTILCYFGEIDREHAASVDRIIPSKGYVKGNIAVISHKANRLKNNATLDELIGLVDWLKK